MWSPVADVWRCGAREVGEVIALLDKEGVETTNCEDFCVPVMQNESPSLWNFAGWQAFHPSTSCNNQVQANVV